MKDSYIEECLKGLILLQELSLLVKAVSSHYCFPPLCCTEDRNWQNKKEWNKQTNEQLNEYINMSLIAPKIMLKINVSNNRFLILMNWYFCFDPLILFIYLPLYQFKLFSSFSFSFPFCFRTYVYGNWFISVFFFSILLPLYFQPMFFQKLIYVIFLFI